MAENATLQFYDEQARRYEQLRARPVQLYTDEAERNALRPYVDSAHDILDLGCGEGRLTRWMAELKQRQAGDFQVHGADFSPEMIVHAKRLNGDLPASYSVGDAMGLEFQDNSFDLIVSCTAPNNFPSLEGALKEIHRVLKPNGVFVATIINAKEAGRFPRYLYYAPYYIWQLIKTVSGQSSGYHRVLFSHDELQRMVGENFTINELSGMRIIPDFIPEIPFNTWPRIYPFTKGLLSATSGLDRYLEKHSTFGKYARFHLVVATANKPQ
ncbi:MAG: class I SAM-dependent methyltransferase [Pseudomonadota bacterium]